MPTLGELAGKGQLHRVARYLRQELSPLDFERAPEALEERIEELLAQAMEIAAANSQFPNDAPHPLRKSPPAATTSEVIASQENKSEIRNPKSETNSKDQNFKQGEAPTPSGTAKFFRWVAESVASERHTERNEDRWLALPSAHVAAVLDGVGGGPAAAEASEWVAQALERELNDMVQSGEQPADWPAALKQLVLELNKQFLTATKNDQRLQGGSTTIAIAAMVPDSSSTSQESSANASATSEVTPSSGKRWKLAYAVVGDSRISIWHKATNKYELTALDDHLLRLLLAPPERHPEWLKPLLAKHGLPADLTLDANQAAKLATILDADPDPAQNLTGQGTSSSTSSAVYAGQVPKLKQLAKFLFAERAIVTQVLGAPAIQPHAGLLTVGFGDRILLASDGIHDNLTERELVTMLATTKFDEVASALVVRAGEVAKSGAARAKMDDMTAVVLEIL